MRRKIRRKSLVLAKCVKVIKQPRKALFAIGAQNRLKMIEIGNTPLLVQEQGEFGDKANVGER